MFVFRTPYIQTLIRRQSESIVNRMRMNSAPYIFFGISPVVKQYHPLPSSMIHVRACFHDSEGDIDFYQMSLSQSESTILPESIIERNVLHRALIFYWSLQ